MEKLVSPIRKLHEASKYLFKNVAYIQITIYVLCIHTYYVHTKFIHTLLTNIHSIT